MESPRMAVRSRQILVRFHCENLKKRNSKLIPMLVTIYRVFSHDVTAAILVSQNNKTAAMLVSQTSPVGVEFFSYVNALLFQ